MTLVTIWNLLASKCLEKITQTKWDSWVPSDSLRRNPLCFIFCNRWRMLIKMVIIECKFRTYLKHIKKNSARKKFSSIFLSQKESGILIINFSGPCFRFNKWSNRFFPSNILGKAIVWDFRILASFPPPFPWIRLICTLFSPVTEITWTLKHFKNKVNVL